jgi:uncharacterized protein (DUF1778 family)
MCYNSFVGDRAALIISCSRQEADTVREKAELERRTMSAYMLRIVMRNVLFDERLVATHEALAPWDPHFLSPPAKPRTSMLIRCSGDEAARIRAAAKRRETTISGFVLHGLSSSWDLKRPKASSRDFHVGDFVRAVLPQGSVITGRVTSVISDGGLIKLDVQHGDDRLERIDLWQVVSVLLGGEAPD